MEVRKVKLSQLKGAAYNPKDRTEGKSRLGQLEKSMTDIGLVYPVAVDKNLNVIDGHRRIQAAINLGWTDIPILIVETDDRDRVYAEVNATASKLTGSQTMGVWLCRPSAVTEHSRHQFEMVEQVFGRKAMERVVKAGMAITVMQDASKVAQYCDCADDLKFKQQSLNWLIKNRNRMLVRAFMKTGLSAKTLFNAVLNNKNLRVQYTAR